MTINEKANRVVEYARDIASRVGSWTEFSNKLFDQEAGFIAKTFAKMTERREFYESPQNDEVDRIFLDVIRRFGTAHGAAPKKSGKFVVRIPKSLHAALEVQAEDEGVSLNQLALSKLSISLGESMDLLTSQVVQAFRNVHDGFSTERVVIDPQLNEKFLAECRALGLTHSDYELNHKLYDVRKSGKASLPAATKRPVIRDYDRFEFASEIAFRFLQRHEGVSLDRVLCDPPLRSRFDEIALRLVPSIPVLKIRAGALNLRKSHKLQPGDSKSEWYELQSIGPVAKVRLDDLPTNPGAYVFYSDGRPLFAGETANLRDRILHHLEASHNKGLPEWLGEKTGAELDLRCKSLPDVNQRDRLSWLRNFINREKPVLNYQKAA